MQTPHNHLQGDNCPLCKKDKMSKLFCKTNQEFIKEASLKHNNLYSYNKTNYINALEKVVITCHKHGDFYQTPNRHLSGQGCPICKLSKGEILIYN